MNTRRSAAIIIAAASLTSGVAAHAQNLLTNPSFELGTFNNRGDGYEIMNNGSTVMTGWTVIDVIARGTTPNSSNTDPFEGALFLDLQGDGLDGPPFGGVTQSFTSTIGQQYHLSFNLGTQQTTPNAGGPVSVSATAGGMTLPFTFNPGGVGTQWGEFGFDFTASNTSTPISIVGTSTAGGAYIGLDLVSVSVVSAPQLNITLLGVQQVQITWNTNHTGYALESAPILPAATWELVTNSVVTAGQQFSVAVGAGETSRFFRLRRN